ncbi:hypothetical protein NP590_01075 [Methylomonas sp. SURF-2]|uniref:Haemolysin-type calcium binding-related domain-containing protein n=1 Tax=Methylomonas subterranea TaxID=2952225 RepID=A0ABT1TB42_9GAMM|nr:carbohydrate-binding domain-containing protein [Methylomonas sp. SURF-2]MCQ8102680.1 hypothetical protein [Methylomonas sp. SURF-2]
MDIYVDGVFKATFAVANTGAYAAYSVDPALLGANARRVDVVFANDAFIAGTPAQDRNLYVAGIKVNGQSLASVSTGVQYDIGNGGAARDGKNMLGGRELMSWGGALRFSLDGNDWLDGGAGADSMNGGLGDDVYVVDHSADTVNEIADGGFDTVRSLISYDLSAAAHVENLILIGTAAIDATGNSLDNTLLGNAASNRLDGGLGADRLEGGQGDDVYIVDHYGDVPVENANAGIDSVFASIRHTLGNHLEYLTLTGTAAIDGFGNGLDNRLTGNEADNGLYGNLGNDTLQGGRGNDRLFGGDGNDRLYGDWLTESPGSPLSSDLLIINAKASLLNDGVAARMAVYVNGNFKTSFDVANTAVYAGYSVDPALLGDGVRQVDVVFLNDAYIAGSPAQDRNLYVNHIALNGINHVSASPDVQYDLGTGSAARDGLNLVTGRAAMAWNGALRFDLQSNDWLDGGAGTDILTGGAGNDTYIMGRGYGTDTVVEDDLTVGNIDTAQFLSDITAEQIWFRRTDNDLEASIIGSGDKLIVRDWYAGSAHHVEQFKTADGLTLLDNEVENLVNAMAAFAPPTDQTSLPLDYQAALAPVLATYWL